MYPLVLPPSLLGDSLFYTKKYVGELVRTVSSATYPWIGTIPAYILREDRVELSLIHQMVMDPILQQDTNVHVLGFLNPYPSQIITRVISNDYPGLLELLEYILLSIGEREDDISQMHITKLFKPFYGLAFVARPSIIMEFTDWHSRVMMFLFSDPKAHRKLWSLQYDSHQPNNPQSISSILTTCLAPYFMNSRGYNIVMIRN